MYSQYNYKTNLFNICTGSEIYYLFSIYTANLGVSAIQSCSLANNSHFYFMPGGSWFND